MRERINSVDFVRGFVMVIMALDHVRDYFMNPSFQPTNMQTTTAALFFTRWITHFCAPTFVFLAGTGAFLQLMRGKSKKELSFFLFTRGLWLVVLELTLVRTAWTFDPFNMSLLFLQVIWALGWSMVALSALIYLRTWMLAAFGLTMIVLHNAFDSVAVDWSNPLGFLWAIFHTGDAITPMNGLTMVPFYPLIPWIGVMAVGFAFGSFFTLERQDREKKMLWLGLAICCVFVLLRAINVYGDPRPWQMQYDTLHSVLSFFNCSKYPPSLEYLCMTLGPSIVLLSRAEAWSGAFSRFIIVFGRVPMFYYLLHIPLIHALSLLFEVIRVGTAKYLVGNVFAQEFPSDYGYSLIQIYMIWIGVIFMLYPACRWYADFKKRHNNPLLSYL